MTHTNGLGVRRRLITARAVRIIAIAGTGALRAVGTLSLLLLSITGIPAPGFIDRVFALSEQEVERDTSQTRRPEEFSLPPDEGAWVVKITTSGGYLGGKGSIIITSRGDAAAGRHYLYACTATLSAEELNRMRQAVAAVNVTGWDDIGDDGRPPGVDLIHTRVELQRRDDGGAERSYKAEWYGGSEKGVPKDLLALRGAMVAIEKRIVSTCSEYR